MVIEVNCFLVNKKLEELGIKAEDIPVKMIFDVSEVSHIRELIEDGEEEVSSRYCLIYMKNGDSFWCDKPYNEIRSAIFSRKSFYDFELSEYIKNCIE